MHQPLRIGHRDAAGHAPENTLLSIETALAIGVDVVEIDVHRSLDGHLIVMHDERVDRTTNGSGYIRDLTLAELCTLQPGVPTLAEVLAAVKGRAALMIEMKVRGIAQDVVEMALGASVYYASFLHSELLRVRELEPDARTIALIDAAPVSPTTFALDARATHAGSAFDSLESNFIAALKSAGIGVFTWTVDDPRDIAHARSLGVDGLISNFPDRLTT
jgi:glycerophosphoryl diester phosphodiesterase